MNYLSTGLPDFFHQQYVFRLWSFCAVNDNDFLIKFGRFESNLDLCLFVIFVDLAHRRKQATKDEHEFNSTKACSFMIISWLSLLCLRRWQLKHFLNMFTPKIAEDSYFDTYFSDGRFNHQPTSPPTHPEVQPRKVPWLFAVCRAKKCGDGDFHDWVVVSNVKVPWQWIESLGGCQNLVPMRN